MYKCRKVITADQLLLEKHREFELTCYFTPIYSSTVTALIGFDLIENRCSTLRFRRMKYFGRFLGILITSL